MKLLETDKVFAFVDIGPIARGHSLVIPKCTLRWDCADVDHAAKLSDLPDEEMADILPALKKIAVASVSQLVNELTAGIRQLQHPSGTSPSGPADVEQRPCRAPGRRPRPLSHDSQARRRGRQGGTGHWMAR